MDRNVGLWIDHKQAYVISHKDGIVDVIPSNIEPPAHYSGGTQLGGKLNQKADMEFRKSDRFVGMDIREPEIDFVHLARSFGLAASRVTDPQDIAPALRQAFASGKPSLIDVRVADGFGG